MEYYAKGYLVTGMPITISDTHYHGVDTDAWPIGSSVLEEWYPQIFSKALVDLTFPLLLDIRGALRYCAMCEDAKKAVRLLYCEVLTEHSKTTTVEQHQLLTSTFLGYDYAYPSGDYYSTVLNDIIDHKGYLSAHWKKFLNSYGLFTEITQILDFADSRKELINSSTYNNEIELGEFTVFRLFKVEFPKPITEEYDTDTFCKRYIDYLK